MIRKEHVPRLTLISLWLVLLVAAVLIILPFARHLLLAVVFAIIFWPLYAWVRDRTGWPRTTAMFLVVLLVLGVLIPGAVGGFFVLQNIPQDLEGAIGALDLGEMELLIERYTGTEADIGQWLGSGVERMREYMVDITPRIIGSVVDATLGLFILFFTLYYLFIQGPDLIKRLRDTTPIAKRRFDALVKRINEVTRGVLYGQILTGLVEGFLLGLAFWILGVPFPVLWGALVVIFSLVPLLGPITVWVPASIWLLLTGSIWQGVALIIFGGVFISQIDNVLRPQITSRYTEVHPVVVLVGLLGGLHLLGFAGFFIGPLILSVFLVFTEFVRDELT